MPESNLKKSIVMGGSLLAAYAAIVAWLFYEQATSWPHVGNYALLGYLILCPGIVFQVFNLAWMSVGRRLLTRRMLTRLVTIPLGLVLAGVLANRADELSMRAFVEAYTPLVARLQAAPAAACSENPKHYEVPGIAEYKRRAARERATGQLKHDDKRFVLAFPGGSMDMDGSVIYYDSGARTWSKFHNNDSQKAETLTKLTEGLSECARRVP